jgi:hypothetical protein
MGWEVPAGVMASVRSPGPFAFLGWINLVAPAFVPVADLLPAVAAEEFALQHLESSIGLLWSDRR